MRGLLSKTDKEIIKTYGGGPNSISLVVPKDFPYDVSIPWWAKAFFKRDDPRYQEAAACHDYALHQLKWSRVPAAVFFALSLQENGVNKWRRLVMTLAVIIHKWE